MTKDQEERLLANHAMLLNVACEQQAVLKGLFAMVEQCMDALHIHEREHEMRAV